MNNDIKNKIIYYLSFGITSSEIFLEEIKILKIILKKKLKFMLI